MRKPPLIAAVVLCGATFLGRAEASETGPPTVGSGQSQHVNVRPIGDASWFAVSLHESTLPHKNVQGLARLFTVHAAPKRKAEGFRDFKPEIKVSESWKLSFSWTGDATPNGPHSSAVAAYGRPW